MADPVRWMYSDPGADAEMRWYLARLAEQQMMEHRPGPRAPTQGETQAALDATALGLSPIPIAGDVAGLAADAHMYRTDPSSRNWLNYLFTGLGVLPFVPAVASMGRATRNVPTGFGNQAGAIDPIILDMWSRATPERMRRIVKSYEDDLFRLGSRVKDPEQWDKWTEHVQGARKVLADRGEPIYDARPKAAPVSEFDKNYELAAVAHFGRTTDLREAGYITRRGELLDFSGKREGGSPGVRAYDHRQAADIFDDLPSGTEGMFAFQKKAKAVRVNWSGRKGEAVLASVNFEPTEEQIRALVDAALKSRGGLVLDIDDPISGATIASRDFTEPTEKEIRRAIKEALSR